MKYVEIDFGQIPEGHDADDYPSETIFVWSEDRPKRDPVTFQLIRPEPMRFVWPEDVRRTLEEDDGMSIVDRLLAGEKVKCRQCSKGYLQPFNPKAKINHCFTCDHCGLRYHWDPVVNLG